MQIAAELGLVGIILIFFLFLIIIIKTLKIIHFSKYPNTYKMLIVPFFIVFVAEIFPLKTTGSFFTTGNATFFWLIVGMLMNMQSKKNNILS